MKGLRRSLTCACVHVLLPLLLVMIVMVPSARVHTGPQVRHAQLTKQQERLLRDMEAEVARRETIAVQSEVQARADRKQPTQTDLYNILQGLRRKIQDTQKVRSGGGTGDSTGSLRRIVRCGAVQDVIRLSRSFKVTALDSAPTLIGAECVLWLPPPSFQTCSVQQAEECDQVIKDLDKTQQEVTNSLMEKQRRLGELQGTRAMLTAELCHLQDTKEQNLVKLLALQGRARHLRAVREGSYVPTAASKANTVEPSIQQQEDRLNAFSTVLHRVCQELPQHQGTLRRLSLALTTRLQGSQASSRTMSL
ncbi:hypothetical protein Z043_115984 [Scleropages formosus]|uniref:Uncharacterized protein n=1 Tax=Scleropages formosus TaxID=113540 RepID=A0A0P7YFW2_SCLFO|nr:hypothetical protein Z043_115984 [Scleropages formosus]